MDGKGVELTTELSEDTLREFLVELRSVPTPDHFQETVERAMWNVVAPNDAVATTEELDYEAIRDTHGDLIGYVDESNRRLPWWLEDFKWTVSGGSFELELTEQYDKSLADFEDLPQGETRVIDISLNSEIQLLETLEAFHTIQTELIEALPPSIATDLESGGNDDSPEFPESPFVTPAEKDVIETSREFRTWMDHVIDCCPPVNGPLTALLMAQTGIRKEIVEDILERDVVEVLNRINLFTEVKGELQAYNQNYHDPLMTLLATRPVFDINFREIEEDGLEHLERAFYETWAANTDRIPNAGRWFARASQDKINEKSGEYLEFARIAFRIPLSLNKHRDIKFAHDPNLLNTEREEILDILRKNDHTIDE